MSNKNNLGTKFIHAGAHPDPSTGAIMTPIYQTSTYVQSAPGVHKGYEYARSQNPTRFALEEAFAVIENGKFGLAFASGVAATDAVMRLLVPGDEVIAAHDMYGGSFRLFSKVHEKMGIKFIYVDTSNADNVANAIGDQFRASQNRFNPLHSQSRGGVQRDYPRMRMRATDKGGIGLVGLDDIVCVTAFAGDESLVFLAQNARANSF